MLKDLIERCEAERVSLDTPLSLSSSFRFPLQSAQARADVIWGAALLLLLPGIGWLLNMGHRIEMVHRMQHGQDPWPAWNQPARLLKNGLITFLGMLYYYTPGILLCKLGEPGIGAVLIAIATLAIPGYMTHYCRSFEVRQIFNPALALSRALQGGNAYWSAWGIALAALALSLLGLLFGLGFLATSVWFWQVAGFSFASVFTSRYDLSEGAEAPSSDSPPEAPPHSPPNTRP